MEPTLRPASLADGEPVRTRSTRMHGPAAAALGRGPALPRALITGKYWLAATGLVVLLWLGALASRTTNNYLLAFDLSLLDWVLRLRTDALTDVMQTAHALGSRWTIRVLFWSTVLVLLVFRRFRHLFVFVGAVVGVIALSSLLAYLFMRPAPLG